MHEELKRYLEICIFLTVTLAWSNAYAVNTGSPGIATWSTAGAVGALTLLTLATNGDETVPLVTGGIVTIGFAIAFPLIASASGSEDYRGEAFGRPGMRQAAWIGYGLVMFDAVLSLSIGAAGVQVPDLTIALMGLLGVGSCAALYVDMYAVNAEDEIARRPTVFPAVRRIMTGANERTTTYGFALKF